MDSGSLRLKAPKAKPPMALHSGFGSGAAARAVQKPKGGAPMVNSPVPGTTAIRKKKKNPAPFKAQLSANLMKS